MPGHVGPLKRSSFKILHFTVLNCCFVMVGWCHRSAVHRHSLLLPQLPPASDSFQLLWLQVPAKMATAAAPGSRTGSRRSPPTTAQLCSGARPTANHSAAELEAQVFFDPSHDRPLLLN